MSKIAIITRTSGRPRYFAKCRASVIAEGQLCSHYVVSDTSSDSVYLNDKSIKIINVNRKSLEKNYTDPAPTTARPPLKSIHNLYFNTAYNKINEDWVYHLDDDNQLIPGRLASVFNKINKGVDLVICRIKHFTGTLPRNREFNNRLIRVAGIDTGCFIARTNLMKKVKWDGWKCGDFRVIEKLSKISNKTQWIDIEVMSMNQQNLGKRNDL